MIPEEGPTLVVVVGKLDEILPLEAGQTQPNLKLDSLPKQLLSSLT
jgi:hypothetical protein